MWIQTKRPPAKLVIAGGLVDVIAETATINGQMLTIAMRTVLRDGFFAGRWFYPDEPAGCSSR